jgi:hypothetical protein
MGWMAQVRFPAVKIFSFLHSIQTNFRVHSASDPMGIRGSPRGEGIKWQEHYFQRSKGITGTVFEYRSNGVNI